MIAIVDYDAGNIKSVEKALHFLGRGSSCDRRQRRNSESGIKSSFPEWVEHSGDAMDTIRVQVDWIKCFARWQRNGTPFLGICLGLQLLFERSDEAPGAEGLGILKGEILRIPEKEGLKIPHMGWNSLHLENNGRLFRGIEENAYVYFVHSYYLKARR